MAPLSQRTIYAVVVLLTSLISQHCFAQQRNKNIKPDDAYINCHLQNVETIQTGDKKVDKQKKRDTPKYNENRRVFLHFFNELTKKDEDNDAILSYFEPDATIEYGDISIQQSSAFIDYMDYLTEHTNEEDLHLGRKQCAGKKYHRLDLRVPTQKKKVVWYFTFNNNHKIKYFKEVLESL